MPEFRKFDWKNECINGDKFKIADGIKQAEKQCNDLRDQLQQLWRILSRDNVQVLSTSTLHRADESGEGNLQPQISNYESAQCIIFPDSGHELEKGEYAIKNEYEPSQESSRHDVRRLRKKFKNYFVDSEPKLGNPVITLFQKQDTQCSIMGSGDCVKRKAKLPFKNSVEAASHVAPSHMKQVAREQALPFIAGTSTSQSHNICLNFQEVLAKLKRRQSNAVESVEESKGKEPATALKDNNWNGGAGDIAVHEPMPEKQNMVLSDDLRSRKFKEVLKNVYKEFTAISQEYDKLTKAYSSKESNKTFLKKQLKKMDSLLSHKEDEIVILISMNRQVKSMKEEASKSNDLLMHPQRNQQQQQLSNTTNLRLKMLLQQMRKLQSNL